MRLFRKKTKAKTSSKKSIIQNWFKFPSTEPNILNSNEIKELSKISDPDSKNKILRTQARALSTNTSLTNGFFELLTSEILGEQGMVLDVSTGNKDLDEKIENSWFVWENRKNCCPYGLYDFEDLEEMVLISLYRDGEAFLHFVKSKDNLQVELIDADAIDNDFNNEEKNIKFGIKNEPNSIKPLEYYVRKSKQNLISIPASDIIHIKKALIPQQRRGISKLASSIFDTYQKDSLKKAELDRSKISSSITGFFVKKEDNEYDDFGDEDDENNQKIEVTDEASVGRMKLLEADLQPIFVPPYNPTNTEYFMKSTDREIARSLGISYSTYTGDLRDVNYSSIRQGTISERRTFKRIQKFLIRKMHNEIFEKWLEFELLNRKISPQEYNLILHNFTFKPQGWEYIDPTKEVGANAKAIENGFKTRTEVLREKGIEVDTFLKDLEKDKQIVEKINEINKRKDDGINQEA